MNEACLLHGVTGPTGSALADELRRSSHLHETHRPLIAPFSRIVARLSGPPALLDAAAAGLPEGAARAEAVAVRLRRAGVPLAWGDPEPLDDMAALRELCRARGSSAVYVIRADPSLLAELQIGSWFQASWRERVARRVALRGMARPGPFRVVIDAAFWAGVRKAATAAEWRRLSRESYVALVYHRLAGEGKPGRERVDTSPRTFRAHLALLRLLGFRAVAPEEMLAFHRNGGSLPRRAFVVTVDDGFVDCLQPVLEHAVVRPQLFVPTAALGRRARWLDGEAVMEWEDVERLARAGVAVGSHTRTHPRLPELGREELAEEVAQSLRELRARLPDALPVLAYPNGAHDTAVRRATIDAGYEAAHTTEKGRNGAGTDPFCLRRISVHASDGPLAVLWKVLTGAPPPTLTVARRSSETTSEA